MFSVILKNKIKWTASFNVLLPFGVNLLAVYHECRNMIGYTTYYLFCC